LNHPSPRVFVVDPARSALRYHLAHRLHRVEGVSSRIQGKAVVQPDGKVLGVVVVPIASFRSGDEDRDSRTFELLGAAASFKGESRLELPAGPASIQLAMGGELTLHEVRRPLEVPLVLDVAADGTARVRGSFDVSLDSHAVQRPAFLFVKVEDTCRIELDLTFRQA